MNTPIAPGDEFTTLVTPRYLRVMIHDEDADAWLATPATEQGVDSDGYRIMLFTWQEDTPVSLQVAVLGEEPGPADRGGSLDPAEREEWAGRRRMILYSETGRIAIEGGFQDGHPRSFRLPHAGTYHVLARWRGGEEARERTREVRRIALEADWDLDRQLDAAQALAGVEQYHLTLWPSPEPLPEDDDE